jgi:electron transfer flavoprotein alpha/beta subunit
MINDDCSYALEQSLELKDQMPDAELIVASMGPPAFEQSLRKAISLGFDRAVLLSDRRLGGSDTFSTGLALATLLKKLGLNRESGDPFIIIAGRQTSDGDTAHVPSQVAENLGIPQVTFVESIEFQKDFLICRRIIEGGYQVLKVPVPCLIAVAPTATPLRRPTLKGGVKARQVKIETWNLDQLGLSADQVGLVGSPTMVSKVVDIQRERPPAVMIQEDDPACMADDLLAAIQARGFEGDVSEVLSEAIRPPVSAPASIIQPTDYPRVDFRQGAKGVMTWVEMHGAVPARSSLEILNPARKLADQLGTQVRAVVVGHGIRGIAKEIIAYGADEVVIVDDPRLREYTVLPLTSIFSQLIKAVRPEIMLLGATTSGRELAPRIASRVRAGVTADCTELRIGEFVHRTKKSVLYPCLESVRPTYGESKLATIVGFWCPQMSTARPGTFELPPQNLSRTGKNEYF